MASNENNGQTKCRKEVMLTKTWHQGREIPLHAMDFADRKAIQGVLIELYLCTPSPNLNKRRDLLVASRAT